MEFEITTIECSSDEQYCTVELGTDLDSLKRQNAPDDDQILENSDKPSESGYVFYYFS